jgi:hypothetical protein
MEWEIIIRDRPERGESRRASRSEENNPKPKREGPTRIAEVSMLTCMRSPFARFYGPRESGGFSRSSGVADKKTARTETRVKRK